MTMYATTVAPSIETPVHQVTGNGHKKPKLVSWEEFQKKYLTREDEYKYEWVNGEIEKTKRSMDQRQYAILRQLRRLFVNLSNAGKISGGFEAEIDTIFLKGIHRRPDISYFSEEQEDNMERGLEQVPQFVIEVISTNDQMYLVHKKMRNYKDAGVQVVWQIFPALEEVHVYSGKYLKNMTCCTGNDLCSAAPALPDFTIPAMEIFKSAL